MADKPLSMEYGEERHIYLKNAQGDIIGLRNENDGKIVFYDYREWGSLKKQYIEDGSSAGSNAAANFNPLRFRGYVYDAETQLYYLNSRYYNPLFCRYLKADGYVSTGQGLTGNNMFAYCGNNSPLFKDPSGMMNVAVGSTGGGRNYNSSSVPGSFVSELFSTIADMGDILSVAAIQQAMDDILSQAKPKNWTYNKFNTFITEQKAQGEKLFSIESKISKGLSIASVAIDVGIGVYDNIMEGKSAGKIVYDATVDVAISSTNLWGASMLGALAGSAVAPGFGTVVGGLAGLFGGMLLSYTTDELVLDGTTIRDFLKA